MTISEKKLLLIINPCSGQMKAKSGLFDMVQIFSNAGFDVTVHITTAKGDARTYVAGRASEFDIVVCCGGDGTLNETVSGIIDAGADTPIGYIPAGTTNDFATTMGIPKTIKAAAQNVVDGEPVEVDIGKFGEDSYFTYIASCGAFTRVSYATPQISKNIFGHFAYMMESVKELSEIKPQKVKLSAPGMGIEEEVLFVSVSNTTSIGGVIGLPESNVKMNDGMFELLLIRAPKNIGELNNLVISLTKKDFSDSNLLLMQCSNMELSFENEVAWTCDGESGGTVASVSITNLKNRIKIIVPNNK